LTLPSEQIRLPLGQQKLSDEQSRLVELPNLDKYLDDLYLSVMEWAGVYELDKMKDEEKQERVEVDKLKD